MNFDIFLVCVAAGAAVGARAAFIAVSARSAVDHYYWLLAARAYRVADRLPALIRGKYLLEDERQVYPPFLGWLLSCFPERLLLQPGLVLLVQSADALVLLMLVAFANRGTTSLREIAVIVGVFGTAPVLVAYNTQLASRAFGNLFLVSAILATALAISRGRIDTVTLLCFAAAAVMIAAVVLAHKMSVQLMVALWPVWAVVAGNWALLLLLPLGVVLATAVTGVDFARLQWRSHAEIIAFWHRHRHELGAHLFDASPIYGSTSQTAKKSFHQPGWRGAFIHASRAVGYCPLVWLAPLTLVWDQSPPSWVIVWSSGAAVVALLTLYVDWLRCLGGGHLYIFNAVPPTALWWGGLVANGSKLTLVLFALGMALTLLSLVLGYRQRAALAGKRNEGFPTAVGQLATLSRGRVAVFPLTAAEEVAFRTGHAVLWGGHGLGFDRLEPIYPVLRLSIVQAVRKYDCNLILFDTRYWNAGESIINCELPGSEVLPFGSWRLVRVADLQHPALAASAGGDRCLATPDAMPGASVP